MYCRVCFIAAHSPGRSSWRIFLEVTCYKSNYSTKNINTVAPPCAILLQHLTSITFDLLHICISVHYCSITFVDSAHQYQIWIARACQGFGAQRDVASCRKRESRGKAKQDIFRSVRGAAPLLPSALRGQRTKGSALSLLLSPLFCTRLAPLSLGCALPSDTPLFLRESESNSDRCHLAWSAVLTATCLSL